ncbi:MAG: hypothetical protein H8E21_00800 [Gammaproteobacteria bacterium]|nr:hypothetical protein [Gammaproteobacteria bacterium]MBL6999894.1 hypothetical protein [Gammaproteobacteria bacterium]
MKHDLIDVTIHLNCSRKPGTLSRLIRDMKKLGLSYTRHQIEHEQDQCVISVSGSGQLNCTRDKLIQIMEDLPGVLAVVKLQITRNGEHIEAFKTRTSNEQIHTQELLTPAILLTAEKRLAETIGPVAKYMLDSAAKTSQNTGQLFSALAEELNSDSERAEFLSIIETG